MRGDILVRDIGRVYSRRKYHYHSLVKKQNRIIAFFSKVRLLIFLLGALITSLFYIKKYTYLSISSFFAALVIFIFVVINHEKIKTNRKYTEILNSINNNSFKRIKGDWKEFKEDGKEFVDASHNYAYDLDIFGKGSLFQWINTCGTYLGKEKLKNVLSYSTKDKEEIKKRQEGIKELGHKIKWRQRFEALGHFIQDNKNDIEDLINILKPSNKIYRSKVIIILFKVIPFINLSLIVMSFLLNIFRSYVGYLALIIQIFLLIPGSKERFNTLNTVYKLKKNIKTYDKMIKIICKEKFNSQYLKDLKSKLIHKDGTKAFEEINLLSKIVDHISEGQNIAYIIMNILFLWDYQCMFELEKWKEKNGDSIYWWIDVVGEFEMLNSLAIIYHDHPDWVSADITDKPLTLRAKSMAHPLIGNRAISNDLIIEKPSSILLITGSNMSGKSTLLRTAGINLILAYAGAPVCAKGFSCSMMDIYTCMRVSDNLEKNISSFYGEILRIKSVVEASKKGEEIFFLLDEIFKGTNSMDRHLGAKILISSLVKESACGMVSTHDLELGDMEKESGGKIKNYHFREYYKEGKIHFDYKLRKGISTTRNALYIMKMAGIDIEE